MPDAFISYSRKDTAFVKKLHGSFKALGREVWVDWEDIPLSSDWRAEISSGITSSNTFIFIVSNDSAVSVECRKEIEGAVKANKRVIPIALYNLSSDAYKELHPSISAHNWIYCRENIEDYDTVFKALIHTMDSDLGHIKEHTRLLVRAQEWQAKQHNSSYLLVGSEIDEAESWLAHGQDKEPLPTEVHAQFILSSRQAASARQRRLTTLAMGALVVMAILAVFAVIQSIAATHNANVARSRELAANAQSAMVNGQFDLAIALGLKANEISDAPSDVLLVLGQAAYAPGTRSIFEYSEGVQRIALSQDGKQAVFSGVDNTLHGLNVESDEITPTTFDAYDHLLTTLAISPDGSTVLGGSNDTEGDGQVIQWDMVSGKIKQKFAANAGAVLALAYSTDGQQAYAAYGDGSVVTWNLSDGSESGRFKPQDAVLTTATFSADASRLASVIDDENAGLSHITVSSPADGQVVAQFDSTLNVKQMTFSPDNGQLLVSELAMELWDIADKKLVSTFPRQSGVILQSAFSPNGQVIVTASFDNAIRFWDVTNAQQVRQFVGHTGAVNTVSYVPGADRIVTGSADKTVRLWDLSNALRESSFAGAANYISGLGFSPDDKQVIAGSWDGVLRTWDATSGEAGDSFVLPGNSPVDPMAYSPVTGYVLALAWTDLFAWNPGSGKPAYRLNGLQNGARTVAISPDGTLAAAGDGKGILYLWDLTALAGLPAEQPSDGTFNGIDPVQTFQIENFRVGAIGFSPDGTQVVLGARANGAGAGDILVFDLKEGKVVWRKTASPAGSLIAVAKFNPKGDIVMTAGDDPAIQLWNPKDGTLIRALSGHGGNVVGAAFSPNGSLIVSASSTDGTVRLWNAATGDELNRIFMDKEIASVAFSNAGDKVAVGFGQGEVSLWNAQPLNLKSLTDWIIENRYEYSFNCIQQHEYRIEPMNAACKG